MKCLFNLKPIVSVVVTCFNYGKYLKQAIDSVLSQTYPHLEIIIINDGSTDNTDEVILKYQDFKNIIYIKQPNSGQAKAKNTGIRHATGDYIAFLDADDAWEKNKLEKQIPIFLNDRVGVVYSRACYIDEHGHKLNEFRLSGKYLVPRSGNVTDYLFLDNFIPFSSSVVRRSYLERFGIFDESLQMGIDWDLWLRLSPSCEFRFVDEPLLLYRIGHAGQMSKNIELRQQCSSQIMNNFLQINQGLVSPLVIRKAYSYTFCNLGEYYRSVDRKKSFTFFLKSLQQIPWEIDAYKGLIKNICFKNINDK